MSTELEKYLEKQRESLDVESPDDALIWEGIRGDMHRAGSRTGKKQMLIRIRNIAATVIILLSVGYIVGDIIGESRTDSKPHRYGCRQTW